MASGSCVTVGAVAYNSGSGSREMNAGDQFTFSFSFTEDPPPWGGAPHLQGGVSPQLNFSGNPFTDSQSCVSRVSVNPGRLMMADESSH